MLTPAEQAILSQLQEKQNAITLPQTPQLPAMDTMQRLIDRAIEQKLSAMQAQSNIDAKKSELTTKPEHAEFVEQMKKTVMNGLTLTQSGKLFALAMKAGPDKEAMFKNAVIGFLSTDTGIAVLQMAVDSFLTSVDEAGKQSS